MSPLIPEVEGGRLDNAEIQYYTTRRLYAVVKGTLLASICSGLGHPYALVLPDNTESREYWRLGAIRHRVYVSVGTPGHSDIISHYYALVYEVKSAPKPRPPASHYSH